MIRYAILAAAVLGCTAWSQESLTVGRAVEIALARNGAVEAARENSKAAGARVRQARGALLPRVQLVESWQRSNNPVFVFGSLLNQRQFAASNFDLNLLNRPPFTNNFQSQVVVDHSFWDNGLRRSQVHAASAGESVQREEQRRVEMQNVAAVVRAYYAAVLAQEAVQVADQALESARADLTRAENRRQAGLTTDADVLSIRVHLAGTEQQRIRRRADAEIARAALNQAMGVALDTAWNLTTPMRLAALPGDAAELESAAASMRPEAQQAELSLKAAEAQRGSARAALLPEVFVRAGFEADRQDFWRKGGANWIAAAGVRWNVFSGFSDRARVEEASHAVAGAEAYRRHTDSAVRLDARRAALELNAATERVEVAKSAVALAEESARIVKNRYEAGLVDVTELLRSETTLLETRMRNLEAIGEQRLAAVAAELAAGRLTAASRAVAE